MKHWKTTLAACVVSASWLLSNLLLFRDLMGYPKRPWFAKEMLCTSLVAVIAILFLGYHAADKPKGD